MTNKEAAEIIRDNAVPSFPLKVDIEMWEAAKNKAIEALEKQIPKKPILFINENYDNAFKDYKCPNCESYDCLGEWGCGSCGQAIDWSDNNDL